MRNTLAEEAGTALFWKVAQQGGVKLLFLCRLLILARLLTPDDFGLVAIAMTGIGVFLSLTDFGMEPALVQNEHPTEQHYQAAWTVGMVRALIVGGLVFLCAPLVADAFGEPRVTPLLRVLALLPLLEAGSSIQMVALIRKLRFRSVGIAKLADALANTVVCIALAPALGVWALVAGTLAGPSVHLVLSYALAPYRPRISLDAGAARPLISFGRWIFITGLITVGGAAVLRAVISRELGTAELGLYFLAVKLAFLPNEVATDVIGAVAFSVYARVQGNVAHASTAFRATLTATYFALAPVFTLMFVLAPSLVDNVLGEQWKGTESLIRLLALAGLGGLIGDAAVPVLKGLGQPRRFALLEGGQTVLLVISAWLLIGHFGLLGTGYAWGIAILATIAASIIGLRQVLHFPFAGTGKRFGALAAASLWGGLTAAQVQSAFSGWVGLGLATATGVANIVALLWVFNRALELRLGTEVVTVFPSAAPLLAKYDG